MRGAHPERNVERTIELGGIVRRGDRVLIACSGGPDSVALAAALHAVAKRMQLDLRLAHVNHGARASAWQDECVAAGVAAGLGLALDVVRLAPQPRDEATLREARYAALIALARRTGGTAVATAHHAEDQSETVLLALFRGTGPAGIGGMRPRRQLASGIDLVRPLLRLPAGELRHYCHVEGVAVRNRPDQCGRRACGATPSVRRSKPSAPALSGTGRGSRPRRRAGFRRARGRRDEPACAAWFAGGSRASESCATSISPTSKPPCAPWRPGEAAAFI